MIQKQSLKKYYEELLTILSDHGGWMSYKNPAVTFTKNAKAGEFDSISDEEYDAYLHDIEKLSTLWDCETSKTGWQILKNTFEDAPLNKKNIPEIAAMLADGYSEMHPEYVIDQDIYRVDIPFIEDGKSSSKRLGSGPAAMDLVKDEKICSSAKNIYSFLDKHILKQDEAKKAAALFLRNHIKGQKRNLLFAGPTGCGKTEIFRQIKKNLYGDIVFVDGSHLTQDGWKGEYKLTNIFENMYIRDAECAIVVIDEADKMFEPKTTSTGENVSFSIQNELLKMIEGDPVEMKVDGQMRTILTKNISFAFLGSFERLVKNKGTIKRRGLVFDNVSDEQTEDSEKTYKREFTSEDLVDFAGVRREIAGRIGNIVQLDPMTETDYYEVLNNEEISPIRKMEDRYSISLDIDDASRHQLARQAAESKMGVRFLNSRLAKLLDDAMFEDENQKTYTIRIPEN